MMIAVGVIVQGVGIGCLAFRLMLVQTLLHEMPVVFVLANLGLVQMTHSVDPGLESLFLLRFTVFDTILQIIVEVGIELIMEGVVIKQGSGVP